MSVDHLGPEAVAAFVDGELSPGARQRAEDHIATCSECRQDIHTQQAVASTMRGVLRPKGGASDRLLRRLAEIPETADADLTDVQALPSRNFTIDGRRFPKTVTDWVDVAFNKFRNRSRPDVS